MTAAPHRAVLVVDDHELVRAAIVAALRDQGINAVPCSRTSARGILHEAASHPAGVVLLDLDLGSDPEGMPVSGVDAVAGLCEAGWAVVIVTGSVSRFTNQVSAAVSAGAIGHVPKTGTLDVLVATVVRAMAGEPVMSPSQRQHWLDLHTARDHASERRTLLVSRLSPRELQVLEQLAEGLRAVEIAHNSVVSVTTVRTQIRSILAKLEVSSQLGAVAVLRAER